MKKTFCRRTIDNNTFQLLALPGTNLFKFEIVNMYGANAERIPQIHKNIYGLSHLIEHLGFRATKDFTTQELMSLLKSEGTYNASTDHDRINYWFKTTTDHVDIAIRLVCNYALNDLKNIPLDEFETEKKVVYNEAKRYADDDQTMFHFNVVPTVCGYHAEDNVIGVPETIDTFTLEDAIELKDIFLANGRQFYNITYDPTAITEEEVISKVLTELKRYHVPQTQYTDIADQYANLLAHPQVGTFEVKNESEQAMTALIIDSVDNVWTAERGNRYLGYYATDTSLNDVIREQHGLTYGISFYEDNISYSPYTCFMCDVSRGTEDLMMDLFGQSIGASVSAFTEEAHEKLARTSTLKRVMRLVNQEKYDHLFWTSMWYSDVVDAVEDTFATDVDKAFEQLDEKFADYTSVKNYINSVQLRVLNSQWSKVIN